MNVYRPLRAALFFYECVRLLLLVFFLLVAPPTGPAPAAGVSFAEGAGNERVFLYVVFLSSGALFPLMALFVWFRPAEYRNYLNLYTAGKIIAVVLFFVWEIVSARLVPGSGNILKSLPLLGGIAALNFADILSICGAWILKNEFRPLPVTGDRTEQEV